ncbi:hypothetical protein [Nannocystis bainbridge]|uniref:Copper type II ascorbate-dependent monooxygenase C-terminal domain-containing protein n=1 Tax=Nannocystis bainbridge TaxID=2995303 RepID=A0ABT5E881_9BACT|nr:hypothetical protein [Nannocystis bainbridge]MDC0722076.1 hypothetical protein [Nannocystis bainbridge]
MVSVQRSSLLVTSLVLAACGDSQAGTDTAATTAETEAPGSSEASGGSEATGTPTTSEPAPTTSTTDGGEAVRPNWHQDIAPLVTASCQSCHVAGGIAPFALTDYEESKQWAGVMASSVALGLMPPWHALETDVCQPPLPYLHDPRLSDEQKAMFQDWADLGAPEGDLALAAPLPSPPSLDLANPTKSITMATPLTVDRVGNTTDFFHCLSLDPGNDAPVYVDGIQVLAGNPKIVHHVLIYVDAGADSASWPGGVKQNCGGGSGIGNAQLIGGWVPGGMPMIAPAGVTTELPAGARLILNVHYHATGGGPEEDKATGLALRWSDTAAEWSTLFTLIGAPGMGTSLNGPLMIPAGASGHVEEYEYTVPAEIPVFADVRVWTVLNHMHKVGVDMRVWVESGDTETCLLHTPKWDFNWQRSYQYDAPIGSSFRVRAGDKVRLRCVYDNTMANPGVVEMLAEAGLDAPVPVGLGEGTLDEMCLTGVGVAIKGGL